MTDEPQEPRPEDPIADAATPPARIEPASVERVEHPVFAGATDTPYAAASTIPPETAASTATPRKRSATVGIIAALAVGALIGGVSGAGVAMLADGNDNATGQSGTKTPASVTVNDSNDATAVTAAAVKASPSVVTISVTGGNGAGTGSGIVLNTDGYILTNTHVVTLDGAAANAVIRVTTNEGRRLDAKLVGTDPIDDLAVIKVNGANLTPAEFADSSQLNVGDTAIAIGAPLGLAGTVTNGIVSALNRSITVASSAPPEQTPQEQTPPQDNGDNPFDFWQFDVPGQNSPQTQANSTVSLSVIQTDAAINPGNSGGALLDSDGKVIGINVAIASAGGSSSSASGSIGVGFAIPSNVAKRIAAELMKGGTASHGLLGANVTDVADDDSQADAQTVGAKIAEVVPGGTAEKAGLKAGDVVTNFNGIPITNRTDLTAQVRVLAAGSTAQLSYTRGGKSSTVTVTLGELR